MAAVAHERRADESTVALFAEERQRVGVLRTEERFEAFAVALGEEGVVADPGREEAVHGGDAGVGLYASQKETRAQNTIQLEHGKPMVYAGGTRGLRMNGHKLEVVELGNGTTEADLLRHDQTDRGLAFLLAELSHPDFPEPLGVIYRSDEREPYDAVVDRQAREAVAQRGAGDLAKLINSGETWVVSPNSPGA